jgi:peptide deformylase
MMLDMRTIVQNGHPVLRSIAKDVAHADITSPTIQKLITDMKKLLSKEEHGVALAAPQVGESLRLFIVSGKAIAKRATETEDKTHPDQVYINPVMTKVSRSKKELHEGCLSVRGYWGEVPRALKATVTAYDEHGKKVTRGASGFLAHIFQHEMDHLNGVLYIDKASAVYEDEKEHE